jgi:hypothetical protein
MTTPRHNKASDLLRVLGGKTATPSPLVRKPESPSRTNRKEKPPRRGQKTTRPQSARPRGVRGRAVQFYLHAEDEKLIREFVVWLAPHRKRINDSIIIKAVLRAAKTGPEFLAAYDAAVKVDGRSRPSSELP